MQAEFKLHLATVAKEINNTFISLECRLENMGDGVSEERRRVHTMQEEFARIIDDYKEKSYMKIAS